MVQLEAKTIYLSHNLNRMVNMDLIFRCLLVITLLFSTNSLLAGEFVDQGNDMIIDGKTGLTWQKSETNKMRWEIAKRFCLQSNLGGFSDWRLPSKLELLTLVERNKFNPSIDRSFFPKALPVNYWTSYTGASAVGSAAWLVNFGFGETLFFNKSNEFNVRCVRGTP